MLNRFTLVISLLARDGVPEYYLVLAARNRGNEHVGWGRRFVSRSHKLRQHDGSDKFEPWFLPRRDPTELFLGVVSRATGRLCFRFL
jgi:hypothetical protein